MLFNSVEFIFAFLPLSLLIYYLLCRLENGSWSLGWLFCASIFFYAWWNPVYVYLLLGSIGSNFYIGNSLLASSNGSNKKSLLILGLCLNLGTLAYFKYANFFLASLASTTGADFSALDIVLPLAISFFTFQQIAFLVDAYYGKTERVDLLRYCVFVSFFPQLIAGPIVHHAEIFPQLKKSSSLYFDAKNFSIGLSQFTIGLFKKVIIADSLMHFTNPIFSESTAALGFSSLDYTAGVVAFSLQIYFDFSAYSDMAIGIGRMFSVRLPENFNSPYKASSIIDFWRRWHITLSRFLKNYLYIPLGGNRQGSGRRYMNILLTMLLGGLWHGAQWQFVFWGFLHGVYLCVNHLWRHLLAIRPNQLTKSLASGSAGALIARLITLVAVTVAWVFFRADSMTSATSILSSILSFDGLGHSLSFQFVTLGSPLNSIFANITDSWFLLYLVFLVFWVLCLPNTQQLFEEDSLEIRVRWQPDGKWAIVIASLLIISVLGLGQANEFIYFQF